MYQYINFYRGVALCQKVYRYIKKYFIANFVETLNSKLYLCHNKLLVVHKSVLICCTPTD